MKSYLCVYNCTYFEAEYFIEYFDMLKCISDLVIRYISHLISDKYPKFGRSDSSEWIYYVILCI